MKIRSRHVATLVLLVAYLGTYAALSLAGQYEWEGTWKRWRAKWCWTAPHDSCLEGPTATALGIAFYPLAKADQSLWHRSERYLGTCF
jgi:hypothetical protein